MNISRLSFGNIKTQAIYGYLQAASLCARHQVNIEKIALGAAAVGLPAMALSAKQLGVPIAVMSWTNDYLQKKIIFMREVSEVAAGERDEAKLDFQITCGRGRKSKKGSAWRLRASIFKFNDLMLGFFYGKRPPKELKQGVITVGQWMVEDLDGEKKIAVIATVFSQGKRVKSLPIMMENGVPVFDPQQEVIEFKDHSLPLIQYASGAYDRALNVLLGGEGMAQPYRRRFVAGEGSYASVRLFKDSYLYLKAESAYVELKLERMMIKRGGKPLVSACVYDGKSTDGKLLWCGIIAGGEGGLKRIKLRPSYLFHFQVMDILEDENKMDPVRMKFRVSKFMRANMVTPLGRARIFDRRNFDFQRVVNSDEVEMVVARREVINLEGKKMMQVTAEIFDGERLVCEWPVIKGGPGGMPKFDNRYKVVKVDGKRILVLRR